MITSSGGKLVTVFAHHDEVALDWTDPCGPSGDMLLSPAAARSLAAWLVRTADFIDPEVPA